MSYSVEELEQKWNEFLAQTDCSYNSTSLPFAKHCFFIGIDWATNQAKADLQRCRAALELKCHDADQLWNAFHALETNALKVTTIATLDYVATHSR